MQNSLKYFGLAFTLAEVLITLAIIGVVSAMTIPTLISKFEEHATVSQLTKVYSTLSSAYTLAVQENGTPENWGLTVDPCPEVLNKLKPYLRVDKDCTDGTSGCWPPGVEYKKLSGGIHGVIDDSTQPKLKLTDGTLIIGYVDNITCGDRYGDSLALQNNCGRYTLDINGYKKPNQVGKDVFQFYLTKYGIIPRGGPMETSYPFANLCRDKKTASGGVCAAWVLENKNLDYLHCSDLSWDGKKKCS